MGGDDIDVGVGEIVRSDLVPAAHQQVIRIDALDISGHLADPGVGGAAEFISQFPRQNRRIVFVFDTGEGVGAVQHIVDQILESLLHFSIGEELGFGLPIKRRKFGDAAKPVPFIDERDDQVDAVFVRKLDSLVKCDKQCFGIDAFT